MIFKVMAADKVDNKLEDFKKIGLYSFFNSEDDKNVNWEEFFKLSNDEQFYAVKNNQIIEDDIKKIIYGSNKTNYFQKTIYTLQYS